jgi:hypothetical protein
VTDLRPRPAFAHASEAELARILDFYEVAWAYEPHTFPILFDRDGTVLESFSPDFYLPELDLYLELTTLRQSLVRKKNRKLRRLRELYPEIRIKLLYARDFRALLLKYGRIALADGLSGAEGQATPPRRGRERPAVASGPPAVAGAPSAMPAAPAASAADPVRGGAHVAVAGVAGRSRRSRRSRAEARARALATSTTTTAGTELTA